MSCDLACTKARSVCTTNICAYNLLGEEVIFNIPYLIPNRNGPQYRVINGLRPCIITHQERESRYKYNYAADQDHRLTSYYRHYVRVKDKANMYDPTMYRDEIVNIKYGRSNSYEKIAIPQTTIQIGIIMKDIIRRDSNEIVSFSKKTKIVLKEEGVRTKRGMSNTPRK